MNTAIIALGSNIYPQENIIKARQVLTNEFKLLKESHYVSTKAIGPTVQPDFINGALWIQTDLELESLKARLKELEQSLGRSNDAFKYAPRTIDLDLIVWNNEVVDRDFYEMDFVRMAVLELCPQVKY